MELTEETGNALVAAIVRLTEALERQAAERPSLLRALVNEERFKKDPAGALLDAALIVLRGHLEHLVTEPTRGEALAMAVAGERIADERRAKLSVAIKRPAKALEPFDGGAALDEELMDAALEKAGGR